MKTRTRIATGAAIAVLAITGTAVAAGGGPGGFLGEDREQQFAQDLAGELEGVSPNQVSEALDAVHEQRMQEQRAEIAEALAAELDGVDAEAVSAALDKHRQQVESSIEEGQRPDPGSLVSTLAAELGKSEQEITSALRAAHEAKAAEHREQALERLEAAVESGELSEEQADEIRQRIESGEAPGPGMPGAHGPGPGGPGFGPGGPDGPPVEGDGQRGPGEGAAAELGSAHGPSI